MSFARIVLFTSAFVSTSPAFADENAPSDVEFARAFDDQGHLGVVLSHGSVDASRYIAVVKDAGAAEHLGVQGPLPGYDAAIFGTGAAYSGTGSFVGFGKNEDGFSHIDVFPQSGGLKIEATKERRRECVYRRLTSEYETIRVAVSPEANCPLASEAAGSSSWFESSQVLPRESKNWFFPTLVLN